ncbi:hypothetical protein Q8W16_00460 [Photobacterium damselae subsp. piscicida]|nr:hypothetical protein [Photobacterium damselae subsp. piscicida]
MVIVSKESKQTVESDLVSYFNTKLELLGLKLNDTKTSVDFFRAKRSGISSKLKRIQSKVSGPISDREIDEQLGHLEGLISLANHMQSQQKSNDSNPLSLVEGQNHDVRGDTLVRFAANKIHKLLKEKRVVTPIDLLMVKFTFYKRSNNLIVHLFAFRKTNGFSY